MSKLKVIKKVLKNKCYICNGKGCKRCNGTGIYKENFYYHIYKGQCFSGDSLK